MVLRITGRFDQSLVPAAGAAFRDCDRSCRTVLFFGNIVSVGGFGVSEMRFCWPSLHALRAETMVGGLPRAFRLGAEVSLE